MPTTKHPIDYLRAMIEAKGWGEIPDVAPQPYSPEPIAEPEGTHEGKSYNLNPDELSDAQEDLIADCFKVVAACLTGPDAADYADLLAALMEEHE